MYITKWTILILMVISVCYVARIKCDEITAHEHVRIINFIALSNYFIVLKWDFFLFTQNRIALT